MIGIASKRPGPIGVDLGSRSVKLLQLSGDRRRVLEAARWDLSTESAAADPANRGEALTDAIMQACRSRNFRGREAVLCLGAAELFVQNIRVARCPDAELAQVVSQEAASRLPYPLDTAEIRYLEAAEIRLGEVTKREVILLACHRPLLAQQLQVVENAGLRPVAVDVEPAALLRCYARQFRRDQDQTQRAIFVHVGGISSVVVIAEGTTALFIKYLEIGGQNFDDAVARDLAMDREAALLLRRHNGDRRADQQDPEVAQSVSQAMRPVVDRLAKEISLCVRYHNVTFRGQPLLRLVLGGGEASTALAEGLAARLDLPCQLGEPLRGYKSEITAGRQAQWDIATGLALREVG